MTAEEIIKRLAAVEPTWNDEAWREECPLCEGLHGDSGSLLDHGKECPIGAAKELIKSAASRAPAA